VSNSIKKSKCPRILTSIRLELLTATEEASVSDRISGRLHLCFLPPQPTDEAWDHPNASIRLRFTLFCGPSHCSRFSSHREKLASQGSLSVDQSTGVPRQIGSSQLTFGAADDSLVVNDIHSQLNRTRVDRILRPKNVKELRAAVLTAKSAKKPLSIAGGRHAMGGQQFGTDMILVDMTALEQIVSFDPQRGLVEVQAGAFWPGFTTAYLQRQQGASRQWGFAQRFPKKDRC